MRRCVILLGVVASGPAAAQFTTRDTAPRPSAPPLVVRDGGSQAGGRDVADVRRQIDRGRREGTLTRGTARGLRKEAGMIGTLSERYAQDGTSDAERREIEMRARVLRDQTNNARLRGRTP